MSTLDVGEPHIPDQLVDQLATGYDALQAEIRRLDEKSQQLENKLAWAKQQYLDALKRFTPNTASKDFHEFLAELDEAGATQKEGEVGWLESMAKCADDERRDRAFSIQRASDARAKISYRKRASENGQVKIWGAAQCALEQDFTTQGTPGKLGCPFAGNSRGASTPKSSISRISLSRRSKRASFHDPIRAETEPSVDGSAPLCPIRFLDQHSPEQVAKYFEEHQHELPRSHEICIKRFQNNEDALRSLDTKYSSVVSMVKELGKMHQPMLPEPEEEGEEEIHVSVNKVETWAKTLSAGGADDEDGEPEEREQRFDRSLKDIRVGESPSRPWGIPVPDSYKEEDDENRANDGMASKTSDPTADPLENHPPISAEAAASGARCPFSGFQAMQETRSEQAPPAESPTKAHSSTEDPPREKSPTQMVFNGPVFIGYPFDQAMSFMEKFGNGRGSSTGMTL